MPSTFSLMDSNLPTLRREDEPEEQIYEIVNFLTIMAETLKYALNNLDTSNFNDAALSDYSEETTGDIRKTTTLLASNQVELKDNVDKIEKELKTAADTLGTIAETLSTIQTDVSTIKNAVQVAGDTITIGGSGKTVNINGDVYINGAKK